MRRLLQRCGLKSCIKTSFPPTLTLHRRGGEESDVSACLTPKLLRATIAEISLISKCDPDKFRLEDKPKHQFPSPPRGEGIFSNERGVALFTVIAFILVLSGLVLVYFKSGGFESQLAGVKLRTAQALYCADSGIEWGRWYLENSQNWTNWKYASNNHGNGIITVGNVGSFITSFTYNSALYSGTLTSIGIYSGDTGGKYKRKIVSSVYFDTPVFSIYGALMGPATLNGNMIIDGRNHSKNSPYNVISNIGTSAIFTSLFITSITPGNNTWFGGTDQAGIDHPANPGQLLPKWPSLPLPPDWAAIIKTNVQGMPTTPDGMVGFPEGRLKQLAIDNNSFYSNGATPATLKSGVTYVELPNGDIWQVPSFSPPADGKPVLLVVHNSYYNATMKNVNGIIPGLVITDILNRVSGGGLILGALIVMSNNPSHLGLGGGRLLFCRETLVPLWMGYGGGTGWKVHTSSWSEAIP